MGIGLSLLLELAFGFAGTAGYFTIFPLFEEFFKGLSIFLVAWLVWKALPSRRHAAMLGAASGLGFAVVENIIFNIGTAGTQNATGGQIAEAIIARWIGLPFMHVLWSAFIGVGIFVILAQRKVPGTKSWLVVPFWLFGWVAHMCWNGLAIAASSIDIIAIEFIDICTVFLLFGFIFRDLLGGHFNFWDFLTPVQEPILPPPAVGPPPPEPSPLPPPPPQF